MTTHNLAHGLSRASSDSIDTYRSMSRNVYAVDLTVQAANDRLRADTLSAKGVSVGFGTFPAMTLTNLPREDDRPKEHYFVYTASSKHVLKTKGRGSLHVRAKDVIFLTTHVEWEITSPQPFNSMSLAIDRDWVSDRMPAVDGLLGRRLLSTNHLDLIFRGLMQAARSIADAGQLESAAEDIARSFLSAMSLALLSANSVSQADTKHVLDLRRDQVKAFIEKHYTSPNLNIQTIANRLRLSPRYIQKAFASDETGPAEHLRNCRLQAGAKMLRDTHCSAFSITDIALACGFSSPAHFSTLFKRSFGMSPSDFREIHLGMR